MTELEILRAALEDIAEAQLCWANKARAALAAAAKVARPHVLHWCLDYKTDKAVCGMPLNGGQYAADWDRSTCPSCVSRRPFGYNKK